MLRIISAACGAYHHAFFVVQTYWIYVYTYIPFSDFLLSFKREFVRLKWFFYSVFVSRSILVHIIIIPANT